MSEHVVFLYQATARALAMCVLLGATQSLFSMTEFANDGFFSWELHSTRARVFQRSRFKRYFDLAFCLRGVYALTFLYLVCGIAVLLVSDLRLIAILATALFVTKVLLQYRTFYGSDGADQMELVIGGGLSSYLVCGDCTAGLMFIAAQSILAYFSSGVAKAVSTSWVRGEAVFAIANTYTYGHRGAARLLKHAPLVAVAMSWGTIAFECAFPACLFASVTLLYALLTVGLSFHLANAFIMGLNRFFWAFIGTYPAIICANDLLMHHQLR